MKTKTKQLEQRQNDGKPPVVCSAYFVSVQNRGNMIIVAENIAEACDKLEKITSEHYIFIHSNSFECVI